MWKLLGSHAPSQLSDARVLLHWATQLASAPGTSWLEARNDYSHTNLGWEPSTGCITGRALDEAGTRAGLKISTLELVLLRGGGRLASQPVDGLSYGEAMRWLSTALGRAGLSQDPPLKRSRHEMPDHPVGEGQPFAVAKHVEALTELERWFTNAHQLLEALVAGKEGASEIRLWPHHLDIATLVPVTGSGEENTSVNIGLSPGDGSYDQPYWYVSPWPRPSKDEPGDEASTLPRGHWHSEGFFAAVLTGEEFLVGDEAEQRERALGFLQTAYRAARGMLNQS